jgi:[protein]-arginine 3-hydroxylase / protease
MPVVMRAAEVPRRAAPPARELDRAWVRPARPVVLTDLASSWPAQSRWSFASLAEDHRDARVIVARTRGGAVVTDSSRGVVGDATTLGEFLASFGAGVSGGSVGYLMMRIDELPPALQREAPLPVYCERAGWRSSKLWISAPGTTSALHFDLADNLHTVIAGRKRVLLYSPADRACVYPRGLWSSIPNGARVDPEAPDYARFPRLARARPLVAELGPGDTLYIPRGFWHHVRSLDASISVNTWWASGARAALVRAADVIKRIRRISR